MTVAGVVPLGGDTTSRFVDGRKPANVKLTLAFVFPGQDPNSPTVAKPVMPTPTMLETTLPLLRKAGLIVH
jgi:hypothetical protein